MKLHRILIVTSLALSSLTFCSCFGDEPANAECDIEKCWVHFDEPENIFFHAYDTLAGVPISVDQPNERIIPTAADSIVFSTRWGCQLTQPVPIFFQTTEGSRIYQMVNGIEVPFINGTPVDFTTTGVGRSVEQVFVVHSEDGNWCRIYRISFQVPSNPYYPEGGFLFKFDDYALEPNGKYFVWTESNPYLNDIQWANGNPGYRLSKSSAKPEEYPTTPEADGGVDGGSCLKLTTCDTGSFGRMANMPIAAGNHFTGTFDVSNALKNALVATRFGLPFAHKPLRLKGYYKFLPGAVKQDRQQQPMAEQDYPDIYCVYYKNTDEAGNMIQLDGANVLSSPNIVGIARINPNDIDCTGTEWKTFDLPIVYTQEVTSKDVSENCYSLVICFSSSVDGAVFQGAIGSTLWIDNVTLECEY